MVSWSADATSTTPPSYTTTAEEDVALRLDATALLVDGDAPSSPQSTLFLIVENGNDQAVTLAVPPSLDGNVVVQRVSGLIAGSTYRLRVTFLTSGNRRAMTLVLICVE